MIAMLYVFTFIFFFFSIHSIRRIFAHAYLWQIKEYRWDRMRAYIQEKGIASLVPYTTIIPAIGAVCMILLTMDLGRTAFFVIILLGFSYYVYRALNTLTDVFQKKITRPKKSLRNLLIVLFALVAILYPLFGAHRFYSHYYEKPVSGEVDQPEEPVALPKILTYVDEETGQKVTPLETATIVIYFRYLFGIDLVIPFLVMAATMGTSVIASISRKKKL